MLIPTATIQLLDFACRHFDPTFVGTKITKYRTSNDTPVEQQTAAFMQDLEAFTDKAIIIDGAYPFAKLFIVPNFTNSLSGMAQITDANRDKLQQGWRTRQEGEAAYYSQWFNSTDVTPEPAACLHIVLYSSEQLWKEGIRLDPGKEWGIVAIMAEPSMIPAPLHPSTLRRNSEGIAAGGNGVGYTAAQMADAEAYHSQWANVQ